jgi:hypothetical protein
MHTNLVHPESNLTRDDLNKTNMKHLFAITFILLFFTQCGSKKEPLQYFSESERDSLLTDMITYVYVPAPYSNNQTKFDAKYDLSTSKVYQVFIYKITLRPITGMPTFYD